jgi:diguanylate cyclase
MAAALRRRAHIDGLTGLPNRDWLLDEGARSAVLDEGEAGGALAILILDIDRFKEVNDTLGHEVGDQLLRQLAERLAVAAGSGGRAVRLDGDEFAVLLTGEPARRAEETAQRIRAEITAERLCLAGVDLDLDLSVGVAADAGPGDVEEGDHETSPADRMQGALRRLMRRADVAMYAAKRDHCGVSVYDPVSDRHTIERLALLTDLREALYSDQLRLAYQPKVDLRDGSIVGVEALLRWTHPVRGAVPPMDFMPAAETTNLMTPLTHRVLSMALAQASQWVIAGHPLRVSINVPPRTLIEADFVGVILDALTATGVPAELLCIELTETSFMEDADRTTTVIRELRSHGVEMSIDDFGTGFSSLSYLRDLPVDEIKIDKTFVTGRLERREDAILIEATVGLAHRLGMTVVAEGVEDAESAAALARLGCDVAQGYLYARPLPPVELDRWLAERARSATPGGDLPAAAAVSGGSAGPG